MKENENEDGYSGEGLRGPAWALFGVLTAAAAKYVTNGGLSFLGGNPPPGGPVTRETLELTTRNQALESKLYTQELNTAQLVWNAKQEAEIKCQQKQLDQLYSMTRLTIPNGNLTPGVGPVQVVPVPPPAAPAPDVTAIVQAVLAAQKASAANAG